MSQTRQARAWMFFLLAFPGGVPMGFLTVVLPFLATKGGLDLAQVGVIIGIAGSANFLRLLWMPVCDMWSSLQRWAAAGTVLSAVSVLALAVVPMEPQLLPVIAAVAFVSQAAATLPAIAGAGLLAACLTDEEQGVAAGFWQGGYLFSMGIGGAAALWAASTLGVAAGGIVAAGLILLGLAVIPSLNAPATRLSGKPLGRRLAEIGGGLVEALREPRCAVFVVAACTPIGLGAASYLWSGMAGEWGVGANQVSLVVGIGAAMASALGALGYGAIARRTDRLAMFLLFGVLLALVAAVIAELPRSSSVFSVGVLVYAAMMGACYAAYTAVILQVIGAGAAATKYTAVNAFGNLPNAYMPVVLGGLHDAYSTRAMLWGEVAITLASVALVWALARTIGWRRRTREAIGTL